jgi:Tol biopolymer transport system component
MRELPTDASSMIDRTISHYRIIEKGGILLAGMIIGLALMKCFQPGSPTPVVSATIKIQPGRWLDGLRRNAEMQHPSRTAIAISSDGTFVVYSAIEQNPGPQAKPQLYLRRMNQSAAKPIPGTEGAISPFLSPDNRWVGFWADSKLKKISIDGGVPTSLCSTSPWLFGANWGGDNSIVFADREDTGLSMVSAEGGKPETLTEPDPKREESSHRLPSWLPNGRAVLFTVMRQGWDPHPWIALLRPDTREWHAILQDAADARYVPTGHLVFLRQGTLMAVQFDLPELKVIGQPVVLEENVMQAFSTNSGYHTAAGQFSISDTGSLIYAAGGIVSDQQNSLVWVDHNGMEQPSTDLQKPFYSPRLSPDGRRIAYTALGTESQVWVYDLGSGTDTRLTGEGRAGSLTWTPDGKQLLFRWSKSLAMNLFMQPYDGSSPMERLTTSEYEQWPGSWSADGKTIALLASHPATGIYIAMLDFGSRRVTPFLNSRFSEWYPEFSPDGRWIAYTSNESKRSEVYVQPFPGPGTRLRVSTDGGTEPLWARNGKQLFYRWQDQMWAVDVVRDGGFVASKPRLLFEKSGYSSGSPIRSYDLSLDGQRFLMVKLEQRKPTPVTEMTFVQNWFEDLKRLVLAGK